MKKKKLYRAPFVMTLNAKGVGQQAISGFYEMNQ